MTDEQSEQYQVGIGAYMVAMRNWNLVQDEAIEEIIRKIKELDAQVAQLGGSLILLIKREKSEC
jgi:hypothetical protein